MKYNVGDYVEDSDGDYFQIREKHDNYYKVNKVDKYGKKKWEGIARWFDKEFTGKFVPKSKLKYNVGDYVESIYGYYFQIKEKHDDYYIIDWVNKYGEKTQISGYKWVDNEFKGKFVPKKKETTLTMQEIANKFNIDINELKITK